MNRFLFTAAIFFAVTCGVSAADQTIDAGQTLTLSEDLILTGSNSLTIAGTPDKRCTLAGNGHCIRTSGEWTGTIRIQHCDLKQLGNLPKFKGQEIRIEAEFPAIDLTVAGRGSFTVESSDFSECSTIRVRNNGESSTTFRNNLLRENTRAHANKDVGKSVPAFIADGNSKAKKFFQGNRVLRSQARFSAPNWLVGGENDADSNLCIGIRIGLFGEGEGTLVRGNYLHLRMPINEEFPYYSQVTTFSTSKGAIGEHNVIRDGEWIVRFVDGEFRYNLITDIIDHDLMQNGSAGRIHHNLFVAGKSDSRPGSMSGHIAVIYPPKEKGEGIEVFNNVFDGGGWMDVPAIEVSPEAFVKSVRNNVFCNFGHKERYYKAPQGMIRAAWNDEEAEKKPPRIGYADFNLFFNPQAATPRNYLLSVAGKSERKDAGFGKNDVPRGGKADEQVDPQFQGPLPQKFPFADEDIVAGKVTVSKILAYYRECYSPAPGSPLIDAGDPADGNGANIGAVETAGDRAGFGSFSK
jgi:hypothetical protein